MAAKTPDTNHWTDEPRNKVRTFQAKFTTALLDKRKFPFTINMAGFPAHYALFEKEIAGLSPKRNFQVTAIEENKVVYKNLKKTATQNKIPNLKISFPYSEPFSLAYYLDNNKELNKDIVYLDYMGHWSSGKLEEIKKVLLKNKSKKYLLIITVGICRAHGTIQNSLVQAEKDVAMMEHRTPVIDRNSNAYDMHSNGVPSILKLAGLPYNKKIVPEMIQSYINDNHKPQMFFAFLVKNDN